MHSIYFHPGEEHRHGRKGLRFGGSDGGFGASGGLGHVYEHTAGVISCGQSSTGNEPMTQAKTPALAKVCVR